MKLLAEEKEKRQTQKNPNQKNGKVTSESDLPSVVVTTVNGNQKAAKDEIKITAKNLNRKK